MPVFVAVVSLGLAFFLFCLLAIHLDERRRRNRRPGNGRMLEELALVPTSARMRSYRRVIPFTREHAMQNSRLSSSAGRSNAPSSRSERATGSVSSRKLSRGGER